jgi:hypothetical protein
MTQEQQFDETVYSAYFVGNIITLLIFFKSWSFVQTLEKPNMYFMDIYKLFQAFSSLRQICRNICPKKCMYNL